ncbi:MAG: hypothetical protein COU90_01525 [Candidatus Ryanbacteria bacterium CG10_big_fil_rev_8_21_14_0_10_43_42]|uniref:Uncharacterized protein n=1 Tax=Candidatus Ryanbacteria bacterium CG10_big_fil_rev_8_21_14_0_10_43_42 TaxID=1974864 RepID=A0A2M8KX88_9BACT|nr:MAG: hypothetical protein COU90_01525 [Candidatus Ryanbacteria bacterium CG10_big_fil_rev_8_21_14_0_10_43_42]
MKTFLHYILPSLSFLAVPGAVLAQFSGDDIFNVLDSFSILFNILISLAILGATFLFLWGIVRYIAAGGDENERTEARKFIVWGIILLAVMVAVWGFVNILLDFFFNKEADDFTTIPMGPEGNTNALIDRLP